MSNSNRFNGVISIAAALVAVVGSAYAADLDLTGQGGQYATSRPAVLVKGMGGSFAPSTVWVPFILPNDPSTATTSTQANVNAVVVETVAGGPIAAVTSFGVVTTSTVAPRVVAVLQTTDVGSTLSSGESVNTINDEGAANRSSSAGSILPDGTLTVRENFASTGQSNIGSWNAIHTLGTVPGTQAPNKTIVNTAVNIGNAGETAINPSGGGVTGSVFLATPTTARDPALPSAGDANLLTGQTHFTGTVTAGTIPASVNGVVVYNGLNNSPVSGAALPNTGNAGPDHEALWLQANMPIPTSPGGETAGDARQTPPVLAVVRTPGGADKVYVAHGSGFSGGTPFSGGSARPLYLCVDTMKNPDGSKRLNYVGSNATASFNTIIIEGDAVGGVGSQHGRPFDSIAPLDAGYADHFTSDLGKKFVDHQATGSNSFTNSHFDMNSKGQVAALWVDEGVFPEALEVRVYDPIWDMTNDRIAGYNLSAVVTFNGDVGNAAQTLVVNEAVTTIETTPGILGQTSITPISGISIDDNGRVAFCAIKETFAVLGDWDGDSFTDDTWYLQNTTNALYVWEPTTNTLHEVLTGGQNGDVLADAFPADGPANNESLALGFFPMDEASDAFNRDGMSRDGRHLAVNFRSGGNETVNGVNVELETVPCISPCSTPDTFNDNGGVLSRGSGATLNERAVRGSVVLGLGTFTLDVPPCCPGNADKTTDGGPGADVNFGDVTSVLTNFNQPANPNGTSPGDADCDGFIVFADITSVLTNFLNDCD